MAEQARREFAPTIILDDQDRFLLQQRDNIPGIFYPGKIGLFGGHREGEETFLECAVRELDEELGYYIAPERFEFLASYEGPDLAIQGGTLLVNFFVVRNVPADRLVVSEGKSLIASPSELCALEGETHPYHSVRAESLFPKVPGWLIASYPRTSSASRSIPSL